MAGALLDMSKFYDTIGLDLLLKAGMSLSFPAHMLVMAIELCMGPRLLKIGRHCERACIGHSGILAGCPTATSLARCYLYPVLHHIH